MSRLTESTLEEPGRVVATGARCDECGAPMLRREARPSFRWVCTNVNCGATFEDRKRHAIKQCRTRGADE
jgi:ssDNA-binding Zn-finger/Zn-ribbon topoisomerase 1